MECRKDPATGDFTGDLPGNSCMRLSLRVTRPWLASSDSVDAGVESRVSARGPRCVLPRAAASFGRDLRGAWCPATDRTSITSATVASCGGLGVRAACSIERVNVSGVTPMSAASVSHRNRRSVTPLPVLRPRVSAAASRCRAARSNLVGSRPSRWWKSATLTASALSTSAVRFEDRSSSSSGTPEISACPLTISPNPTPYRAVNSARSTDWYRPPRARW